MLVYIRCAPSTTMRNFKFNSEQAEKCKPACHCFEHKNNTPRHTDTRTKKKQILLANTNYCSWPTILAVISSDSIADARLTDVICGAAAADAFDEDDCWVNGRKSAPFGLV